MGNAISLALTDAWYANHQRRVQKWLDNATEDSVLHTLSSSFFPDVRGYGGLSATRNAGSYIEDTFAAYGSIDPIDRKRYWRETDLGNFLGKRFPVSELQASIPILWRCFHFNAYFPFPHEAEQLDYSAFQRAIGLLAADGSVRLGDNADGITMDADRYPDAIARASKRLCIMFKSLSIQNSHAIRPEPTQSSVANFPTTEEDLMDVLCLTQPDDACIMPAPMEELRPHAKRILRTPISNAHYSIPCADFRRLIRLLLCIRPERSPCVRAVCALPTLDIDLLDGIADALLKHFNPNERSDISWHEFNNVISTYLPNFSLQFHLLFKPFLSPSTSTSQSLDIASPTSGLPTAYAQYLSLFLHPPIADPNYMYVEDNRLEALFALQTIQTIYSASPATFSVPELVTALTSIMTGTLLLVTGDAINRDSAGTDHPHQPPLRVTFGACVPTPWDLQRQRRYKANPAQNPHNYTSDHVLFQLEPRLELLLPDADAWIMDLISITDSGTETGNKGGLRFGADGGSGLSVDFDTGIATLRSVSVTKGNESEDSEKQGEKSRGKTKGSPYTDISAMGEGAGGPADGWETRMRVHKLEIYDLGGSVAKPFDEKVPTVVRSPRLRSQQVTVQINKGSEGAVLTPPEPQVGRDELRKRIEGFGSAE